MRQFRDRSRDVKTAAKSDLANWLQIHTGAQVDPASLFDVQAKRIYEYKRQHLNLLHSIRLYRRLKHNSGEERVDRAFVFGGKAAPGYYRAKLIIRLINSVAEVVNGDSEANATLRVAFMPDVSVKNGRYLYPAADLSEQILLAGKEASGNGSLKFSMNGVLTSVTLDGANVEIREQVGEENFSLFVRAAQEVHQLGADGSRPWESYEKNQRLRSVIALIDSGAFSSGRSIAGYARDIWKTTSTPVSLQS
jgi:starch phosphorylase